MNESGKKTAEELNRALYDKVSEELVAYRDSLLSMSPADILDHAYRYAIREDIVNSLELRGISEGQAKQLLQADNALDAIFAKWENLDGRHMDHIHHSIECAANELFREQFKREQEQKRASNRDAR